MKLKRKRIGDPVDRHYNLYDRQTGRLIADAVMTGEWGRDDYPWDWHLVGGVEFDVPEDSAYKPRSGGSLSTLTEVIEYVEGQATQFGLIVDGQEAH